MGATGIRKRALGPLVEGISRFYSGHEPTGATGIRKRALGPRVEGISRFHDGHEPTVAWMKIARTPSPLASFYRSELPIY